MSETILVLAERGIGGMYGLVGAGIGGLIWVVWSFFRDKKND